MNSELGGELVSVRPRLKYIGGGRKKEDERNQHRLVEVKDQAQKERTCTDSSTTPFSTTPSRTTPSTAPFSTTLSSITPCTTASLHCPEDTVDAIHPRFRAAAGNMKEFPLYTEMQKHQPFVSLPQSKHCMEAQGADVTTQVSSTPRLQLQEHQVQRHRLIQEENREPNNQKLPETIPCYDLLREKIRLLEEELQLQRELTQLARERGRVTDRERYIWILEKELMIQREVDRVARERYWLETVNRTEIVRGITGQRLEAQKQLDGDICQDEEQQQQYVERPFTVYTEETRVPTQRRQDASNSDMDGRSKEIFEKVINCEVNGNNRDTTNEGLKNIVGNEHDFIVREQERILQEICKKNEEERLSNELVTKLTLDDGRFVTETGSKKSSQTVSSMKSSKTTPSQSMKSPATRTPTKLTGSRCNLEKIAQLKASAEKIGSFQTRDRTGGN